MKRMLFNATQAEELRVAIVDGQSLIDLDIETLGKEQRKGNVYKGVITRIEPSLEACFVDYGTDRHGFLPFKEVSCSYFNDYDGGRARIQNVLSEGMEVIVQVEKDERGNKGAALTTFVSLAGRYLVLMPNNPRGGGVSRRIEGEERQELKAAMAALEVSRGMSLIARTAGIGRSVEELQWDLNYLQQLWQAIEAAAKEHSDPYLLFMESALLIRAIRDYFQPDIGEILIDTQEVYDQVSEFMSYVMPAYAPRLKHYNDHTPLFSRFQIEHQIESAFSRSVTLPSGGAIVIDHTEALVSIDVNSARATRGADIEDTAFKTNMEAAEEVARQMRLRDLGGLVVIDFIDMENSRHQRDVEITLREALKKDRARVQTGKLSRFGLLELSRQRLKPSLGESSHNACPRCGGTGFIRGIESTALHVLRIIQEEAMKDNTGEVHAQVPVDVATFLLNEKRAELFGLEERLDVSVLLIPNTHLENPHYQISRVRTDNIEEDAAPSYQQMAKPEDENALPFAISQNKPTRPEPAVKGIKHSQPAPMVSTSAPSVLTRLKHWLSKVLGAEETAVAPQKSASDKNRQHNGGHKNRSQERRHAGRRGQQRPQERGNGQPQADGDKNERKNAAGQRLDKGRTPSGQNQGRAGDNKAVATPEDAQSNRNRRRRQRHPRQEVEWNDVETLPVVAADQTKSAVVTPAVETTGVQEAQAERRKHHNGKHSQDKQRGKNQRRYIPSAEKIVRYLDVHETGARVTAAIAHVMAPPSLPSAEPPVTAAVPLVPVPFAPDVAKTAAPMVRSEPVVVEAAMAIDLGGLDLIETRIDTVAAVAPAADPVLRRADVARLPQDETVAVVLQQVETHPQD